MANLGIFTITNSNYENIETLTEKTLTSGNNYVFQPYNNCFFCEKVNTPEEEEGFFVSAFEKIYIKKSSNNLYFKVSEDEVKINIDESNE